MESLITFSQFSGTAVCRLHQRYAEGDKWTVKYSVPNAPKTLDRHFFLAQQSFWFSKICKKNPNPKTKTNL